MYPVNDVILKRGKQIVKIVFITMSREVLLQNRYKINGPFCPKTFNADHIHLTCSKHKRHLASEREFP